MGGLSEQYVGVLKLVGLLFVLSAISYVVVVRWNAFTRIHNWFVGHINPSGGTSVVISVVYQPRVGVGVNQSYGLIRLATSSFVKYRLTIEPHSCLSFDPNVSVYEINNETVRTVDIPVYFHYTSSCTDFDYKITLWLFSQKEGKFIKAQTIEVVPQFNFANLITVIPNSGMATVFETDLKDLAGSSLLSDYSSNLDKLKSRGILIVSNLNYPLVVKFTTDADTLLIASNKRTTVTKLSGVANYTLLPSEVILVLPTKNSNSLLGYYVNLKIGVFFGGRYVQSGDLKVKVLPPTGLVGVAFQNTTFLIPIARKKDYFLGSISTSADYVEDAFDFKTFSLVPDLSVLTGSGSISPDWTVIKNESGNNWVVSVYAYKPDLDKFGISREYLAQKIELDKHYWEPDGTEVYEYNVTTAMYYNEDSNLTVFASVITNPGDANAFSSLLHYTLFGSLFDRDDWPKDRAMFITAPTFIIGLNTGIYSVEGVSTSISVGEYSYRIWKFPDEVTGIWNVSYPDGELVKYYTPGTKAYTFVGDDQVVLKLLLAGEKMGYYHLKSGVAVNSGLFETYFGKFTDFVSEYDVGQTNMECSLIDRIKSFDLRYQHLGCYQQTAKAKVVGVGGGEAYVIAPVKLMLAYHQDVPDKTTGILGHFCSGAGGILLEREDMVSLLAPWTEYWCKSGNDGWVGKKANSLLNLEVRFTATVKVKVLKNGIYTHTIEYKINYNLIVYLPLLRPYWDSNYLFEYAMKR